MNILTWVAIAIILAYALNGLRRGLVRTVFATFTTVIAIAVAINISPYISRSLQKTVLFDMISENIEASLFGELDEEPLKVADQTELIQNLPLPASVRDSLLENNNAAVYDAFGITAFKAYVANYLACLIMNALSFILVFLVSAILLRVIAACLDIISYLPVLHNLNKLGGFIFGTVNGFVILWIVCIAVTVFSGTEPGTYIYSQINDSLFLRSIYDNNYFLTVIANLKYLLI